jgi:hypothetical protein
VGCQQKTESGMGETGFTKVYQRRIWTSVVGMAIAAGQIWVILAQRPMQCGGVKPLCSNIGVTGHAPVRHCGRTPEWGMA